MTKKGRRTDASEELQTELARDLRREIDIGVEQAKAGQLSDGRAFFEGVRRNIKARVDDGRA